MDSVLKAHTQRSFSPGGAEPGSLFEMADIEPEPELIVPGHVNAGALDVHKGMVGGEIGRYALLTSGG